MDYGIGIFLAGLVGGAGIGWYVAVVKIHLAYGNPEDLTRELMLYKGLLYKAGLSVDGEKGELPGKGPASAGLIFRPPQSIDARRAVPDNAATLTSLESVLGCTPPN